MVERGQGGRGAFVELRGYLYRSEIEPAKQVQMSAALSVTNELLSLFTEAIHDRLALFGDALLWCICAIVASLAANPKVH